MVVNSSLIHECVTEALSRTNKVYYFLYKILIINVVIKREIKVKGQKLGTVTSFKYLGELFQMMAPNKRFSQGLHKPLQLLQS